MSTAPRDQLKLTYAQYVYFPDDGNRHEVIDGDHYMNPAPSTYHQTVSKRLQYQLYQKVELAKLGQVFDAPVDVQLSDFDIVQPDLVVVLNESRARVTPSRIIGPPDLLVEILSPSTAGNDRDLKRRIYERAGVREYWIIDPTDNSVLQLVAKDNVFQEQSVGEEVPLAVLSQIVISFSEIW